jgi:hypothetical protein
MRREFHVRFREGGGVRFPSATRLVIFGERHLRVLVRELERHYNFERFHQGLGGRLVRPPMTTANDNSASKVVCCRSRLGGLLNYYDRGAA